MQCLILPILVDGVKPGKEREHFFAIDLVSIPFSPATLRQVPHAHIQQVVNACYGLKSAEEKAALSPLLFRLANIEGVGSDCGGACRKPCKKRLEAQRRAARQET